MPVTHPICIRSLATVFFALGLAAAGRGQTADPAADPAAPAAEPVKAAPAVEPAPTPARPRHARVMSDEVAASLATGMPKYNPPKPVEPKADEDLPDLRETDQPRNRIIRLPKYVVKEPRPPVFNERDLHTKSGMADLAMRRNAGLKFGDLGGLNQPIGLMMYQEQERLDNMANLADDAKTAKRAGDTAASDYIMRESTRAYFRPSDFAWNSDHPGK